MIPVAEPFIDENELQAATDAVRRAAISGHVQDYIVKFENGFSGYCGARCGIAVNNGTTAVHLAITALGIQEGDEVLVSTYTNMATFFGVMYQSARPVAIDICPDTWNINPELIEKAITPRTKAILVVHAFGHPVDMDPILEIARRHGLFVIEDAAQAHGALYKGRKCGSLSDIASFSFYANKLITTGEGGMVVTDNVELAETARQYRNLCYGLGEDRFQHEDVGFNYRMSNLHAAIGWAQLEKLEANIAKKRQIADWYKVRLESSSALQLPVERNFVRNVYWMYHVVLNEQCKVDRRTVMARMAEEGIQTRPGFTPFNQQKIAHTRNLARSEDCPVANRIGARAFYIPSGVTLAEDQAEKVSRALLRAIEP